MFHVGDRVRVNDQHPVYAGCDGIITKVRYIQRKDGE